ncbi:hypothetical protein F4781DRAFT_249452 [Annulohypoxylon bovei var. microspora]|nr:hypothetical protein F4781DRAFT_249452 [Annulohypoxylon bovei var. microspora]
MPHVLLDLVGQYPVLESLSSYLSTLDLFHLGLTCRDYHAHILSSTKVFEALRRRSLCDGRELRRRQDVWSYPRVNYMWGTGRKIHRDEEIEVKLFATRCDAAGALPCRKCGINVCEECRQRPRVNPERSYPDRRPHLNGPWQNENLMCLCDACDAELEAQVRGRFLNELCDCDLYKRWICSRCAKEEGEWTKEYYKKNTVREVDDYDRYCQDYDLTKVMTDHQFDILFYCTCGAFVPQEARPRCAWCKRKHRPEGEWSQEMQEVKATPFDDDSYPIFDPLATSYPTLAYDGPIYQCPLKNNQT